MAHLSASITPLSSLVCGDFLCSCHFPMWCPGSVVVLDLSIPDLCLLSYFYNVYMFVKPSVWALDLDKIWI